MKSKPSALNSIPVSTFGNQAPERLLPLLRGGDRLVDRLLEVLVVELAGNAERDREVEMADPQAVDAVDGGDRIGVLDAVGRLDLAEERRALVGRGELVGDRARPIAVVRHLERHAAHALGIVLHRIDDVPRFVGRADHRQHQALGAHVHGAGDVMVLLGRNADDDRQLRRLEIADGALHRLEMEAGMLEVEEHEVAPGRLQDVADAGGRELDDEVPELGRLRPGHFLEALKRHSFLPTGEPALIGRQSRLSSTVRQLLRRRGRTRQSIFG